MLVAVLLLLMLKKPEDKQDDNKNEVVVTDYLSCAEAGYPIMESYPLQCKTPDGRTFVEDLTENAEVVLETPTYGALVTSPLTIKGKAKGNWFFEDNLPVTLKDQNGKILAQKGATSVDGNWMTTDFVNFTVTLEFTTPTTQYGVLLIEKDNPSGLEENGAAYAIPVTFK